MVTSPCGCPERPLWSRSNPDQEVLMRIGTAIVVIWLLIGAIAAGQRSYFGDDEDVSCAKLGTGAVTIVAGPLNSVGANPKVNWTVREPPRCDAARAVSVLARPPGAGERDHGVVRRPRNTAPTSRLVT